MFEIQESSPRHQTYCTAESKTSSVIVIVTVEVNVCEKQTNKQTKNNNKKNNRHSNSLISYCNDFYALIDDQVVGLGMENTKFPIKQG